MKVRLIILTCLITSFTFAQKRNEFLKLVRDVENNKLVEGETNLIVIEGHKYERKNFLQAKISPFNNTTFSVRYNAVDDEFEVLKGENDIITLDKNGKNNEITIGTKKYVTINNGYFVEIFKQDNFAIYKKEFKKYNPKQVARSSYDKPKKAYYDEKINEAYYYSKNNSKLEIFKLNSRGIKSIFPEHSKKIKTFTKQNKINYNSKEDLTKLFEFINTL
jgi:hypothetical protein